jgi:hypothetical protein
MISLKTRTIISYVYDAFQKCKDHSLLTYKKYDLYNHLDILGRIIDYQVIKKASYHDKLHILKSYYTRHYLHLNNG